jgi:hypothetical protein
VAKKGGPRRVSRARVMSNFGSYGIGAVLAGYAKGLPETSPIKTLLIIASPGCSLAVATAGPWIVGRVNAFFDRRNNKNIEVSSQSFIDIWTDVLKTHELTDQQRSDIERRVDSVRQAKLDRQYQHVLALITDASDIHSVTAEQTPSRAGLTEVETAKPHASSIDTGQSSSQTQAIAPGDGNTKADSVPAGGGAVPTSAPKKKPRAARKSKTRPFPRPSGESGG